MVYTHVHVARQEVRKFPYRRHFNLAICMFGVIGVHSLRLNRRSEIWQPLKSSPLVKLKTSSKFPFIQYIHVYMYLMVIGDGDGDCISHTLLDDSAYEVATFAMR